MAIRAVDSKTSSGTYPIKCPTEASDFQFWADDFLAYADGKAFKEFFENSFVECVHLAYKREDPYNAVFFNTIMNDKTFFKNPNTFETSLPGEDQAARSDLDIAKIVKQRTTKEKDTDFGERLTIFKKIIKIKNECAHKRNEAWYQLKAVVDLRLMSIMVSSKGDPFVAWSAIQKHFSLDPSSQQALIKAKEDFSETSWPENEKSIRAAYETFDSVLTTRAEQVIKLGAKISDEEYIAKVKASVPKILKLECTRIQQTGGVNRSLFRTRLLQVIDDLELSEETKDQKSAPEPIPLAANANGKGKQYVKSYGNNKGKGNNNNHDFKFRKNNYNNGNNNGNNGNRFNNNNFNRNNNYGNNGNRRFNNNGNSNGMGNKMKNKNYNNNNNFNRNNNGNNNNNGEGCKICGKTNHQEQNCYLKPMFENYLKRRRANLANSNEPLEL